jgi:predicted nucleic acid-binding protein
MKVLFDTSILVAALIDSHPKYSVAFPWLLKVKKGEIEGYLGSHTLAELYAVLSSLPTQRKISTTDIWRLIQESILKDFEVIELTKSDYRVILESLSKSNVRGGATYDALIAHAAHKADVDKLLTFNSGHFKQVCPSMAQLIEEPI